MEEISGILLKLPGLITTVVGAGPVGWAIGGVFLVLVLGATIFGAWWAAKKAKEIAHKKTDKNRRENEGKLPSGAKRERDARSALEKFRDWIKG